MEKSKTSTVKALFYILLGILAMLIGSFVVAIFWDTVFGLVIKNIPRIAMRFIRKTTEIVGIYFCFYILITKILKKDFAYFRIKPFRIKPKFLLIGLLLPMFVIAFVLITNKVNVNSDNIQDVFFLVAITLINALNASITEEILFRGYIMKLCEEKWGKTVAIIAPSIIFAAAHLLHLEQFDVLSILQLLASGTAVGILFSLVTYSNGSIWASVFVHGFWNAAIIGEVLNMSLLGSKSAIFSVKLSSPSQLLTGGAFGIEASLVAIIGYLQVIGYLLLTNKKALNNTKTN